MGLIEHIASIPLFQGLPRKQHEDLSMIVIDQVFKRGQMVFSEGDAGNGLYVLISGRVEGKLFQTLPRGKGADSPHPGGGGAFGEAAVFAGERFPANAETLAESRVFFSPRAAFIKLIGKNPTLALNMMAVLSRRLRKFANLVEDLSLELRQIGRLSSAFEREKEGNPAGGAGCFQEPISKPPRNDSRDPFPDPGEDGPRKIYQAGREEH